VGLRGVLEEKKMQGKCSYSWRMMRMGPEGRAGSEEGRKTRRGRSRRIV
jgi:hypothetical protein